MSERILVLGGGVFGVASALELAERGHAVTLVDDAAPPVPRASSTDISKVVRADYDDPFYVDLADRAWDGWLRWNRDWPEPPLRSTGALLVAPRPMTADSWEGRVHALLDARGAELVRLDAGVLRDRFPAFATGLGAGAGADAGAAIDGYFNPRAGWAPSAAVVATLLAHAVGAGVALRAGARVRRIEDGGDGVTVELDDGARLRGERAVVSAGAWTPRLVPESAALLRAVAQPVLHFRVTDAARFSAPAFPVWALDLTGEGWYGFPSLADGTLKIGNHGPGLPVDPDAPGDVAEAVEATCRAFLRRAIPELADAPRIWSRHCLYCDAPDGDFLIDRVPDRPRIVVAAGGSGHGFKFGPIIGGLVADVVAGGAPLPRFAWRDGAASAVRR